MYRVYVYVPVLVSGLFGVAIPWTLPLALKREPKRRGGCSGRRRKRVMRKKKKRDSRLHSRKALPCLFWSGLGYCVLLYLHSTKEKSSHPHHDRDIALLPCDWDLS
ncbi:hypothetical protein B0H65DRAFT_1337 [Neurospora tetraspora]|uniref:Uncharacterized protein n=1 Tax=Neurospora tetraspora TaxID=94610 RepID=A0AAE0JNI5_9PEZI|nr:hypothetical protein B0H65DRAFT_1337 [Neurospora tetraspora]